MNGFRVEYTKEAAKALKKIDRSTAALILGWVRKNLVGCADPRAHGKSLTANRSGQWRYRIGNYRLLAYIDDRRVVMLMLSVGHRSEVYRS